MRDKNRPNSRGDVRLWLRRNVWLVVIAAIVLIYGAFVVRTIVWAHAFSKQERTQEMGQKGRDGDAAKEMLKEMSASRSKYARTEEEKKGKGEDGREQLIVKGEQQDVGEQKLRSAEESDTVAHGPFEDANGISVAGAKTRNKLEDTLGAQEMNKWKAVDDQVAAVVSEMDYRKPVPQTALVGRNDNSSDHLRTGIDELSEPRHDEILNVSTSVAVHQETTLAVQIQSNGPTSRRLDKSRLASEMSKQANVSIPFEKRHHIIFGYNATLAYLQLYTKPVDSQEELFLFFTCGDDEGGQDDWTPNCAIAREKVYATFAKSPSTNRLLTIRTGTRQDWAGQNAFTQDSDLRLLAIPTLMRWDGGAPGSLRSTWGVLIDNSIMYEPLLRYLFRNTDEQDKLLWKPNVETKEIVTLRGYAQYRAFMEAYVQSGTPYPMFMMMVSGRFQHNNRLWCPWCRQVEMPIEYAFYAYAPTDAKLIIVETYDTLSEWRNPDNEFKKDPQLAIKGVPWFYRVHTGRPGEALIYQRIKKKFFLLEPLQQVFESSGYQMAIQPSEERLQRTAQPFINNEIVEHPQTPTTVEAVETR